MPRAYDLHITGLVQGVGFRPFVYRLATRYQLSGWVLNSTDGVHAHIEGEDALLKRFLESLELESPPAAQIDRVRVYPGEFNGEKGFAIRPSAAHEPGRTRVSPDLATCADCLHELFDTSDRRYAYPFINCTNCGPRFTIIEGLPYDRPLTSMSDFTMCEACAREYADPGDRRFHAQPDACFDCGPHLSLRTAAGRHTAYNSWESQALIAEAAGLLQAGGILALKGLGGYHLACSATDESAVQRLRERKQRPDKPLACMFRDLGEAREYCEINDQEEQELRSPAAPIVLLRCRAADWAEAGTDGMA
ncbi:MAG: Sua5/YciO/YrdC/YwlC family protein, partial [Coriobacteriia bacterium]|nr:Sua5/YciO/YrdC/YwlC family protein [Coriobacteriia bacterium]